MAVEQSANLHDHINCKLPVDVPRYVITYDRISDKHAGESDHINKTAKDDYGATKEMAQ